MNAFPPARQRGYLIHGLLAGLLIVASLVFLWLLLNSSLNLGFAFWLAGLLVCLLFGTPVVLYRLYALNRANYLLSRDTLRLVWGLRVEEIPLNDVEWVRPVSDLTSPLRLPFLALPGALLGLTSHPDLREVEFLASEPKDLLLIATARRVFAISPAAPAAFTRAFQLAVEMGSLATPPSRSEYPAFVLAQAWQNRLNRAAWLLTLFFNLGLFLWVTAVLPSLSRVSLGFSPLRQPLDPAPAPRLMLLPLLSALSGAAAWLAGLFFYRRPEQRVLGQVLWVSAALSALLFLLAVFFILRAGA